MTSLEHLLPDQNQTVRCASHAKDMQLDPGGTAIRADRVVIVQLPLPWPKPVFELPLLAASAATIKTAMADSWFGVRVLVAQPRVEETQPEIADSSGDVAVNVFDRGDAGVIERRLLVAQSELAGLLETLATVRGSILAGSATVSYEGECDGPAVLLCTQGSHDVCCGSEGERLAKAIEQAQTAEPDSNLAKARLFRVSHTGGHKFAPTAMVLPSGRMWAGLDLDLLRNIIDNRRLEGDARSEVWKHCRGWWGADVGFAQVAERAVAAQLGMGTSAAIGCYVETVETVEELGEAAATDLTRAKGTVTGPSDVANPGKRSKWEVSMKVKREVPTIACRELGGLPFKKSVEYEVESIVQKS